MRFGNEIEWIALSVEREMRANRDGNGVIYIYIEKAEPLTSSLLLAADVRNSDMSSYNDLGARAKKCHFRS